MCAVIEMRRECSLRLTGGEGINLINMMKYWLRFFFFLVHLVCTGSSHFLRHTLCFLSHVWSRLSPSRFVFLLFLCQSPSASWSPQISPLMQSLFLVALLMFCLHPRLVFSSVVLFVLKVSLPWFCVTAELKELTVRGTYLVQKNVCFLQQFK